MGGAVGAEELRVGFGGAVAVRDEGDRVVVSPATTEEVAAVLRFCNERGLRVEIAGAGTKRMWGGVAQADLVLDMRGLTGVREHSWQDLTATVGAGTPWAEMQRVLAAHGQMVALDPVWAEQATIGGVLATNDSGSWRPKYGSARDLVIGMTIVLADGTVAKSGGKVVKNVAGYDLHKLMIGAFGTLGVVTEVTFRLHPARSGAEVWTFRSDTLDSLGVLMMRVLDSQLGVHALQLRASPGAFFVDVELTGESEVVAAHGAKLMAMAGEAVSRVCGAEEVFGAREKLFKREGGSLLKITMLPSAMAAIAESVVLRGGEAVVQAAGTMIARLPDGAGSETFDQLRAMAHASGGGTVSVLSGDGGTSVPDASVFSLMREIKRQFDPERILNRGLMGGV